MLNAKDRATLKSIATNLKDLVFIGKEGLTEAVIDQIDDNLYAHELIKIKDEDKRNFYMHECINSNWDVRELQRQRTTLLYERIASSKDKSGRRTS